MESSETRYRFAGDTAAALDASQKSGKPSSASPGVPAKASKGIDEGTIVSVRITVLLSNNNNHNNNIIEFSSSHNAVVHACLSLVELCCRARGTCGDVACRLC